MVPFRRSQYPTLKHWVSSLLLVVMLSGIIFCITASSHAQDISDADVAEIEAINQAIREKGGEWVAGETSLTRLPIFEKQRRLGLIEAPMIEVEQVLTDQPGVQALPSSLDWRNNGGNFVTSVRDQKSCGSCWAFATTAALESAVLITTGSSGTDLDVSEQVLVSCGNAGGCGGGYPSYASQFIKTTGLPVESCYPYTGTDGSCANACANWQTSTYKIKDYYGVSKSVDSLKSALYTYGPLVTTMSVYQDFFDYRSGIYSYVSGSLAGGHAILLIGYDDAGQYFICKNSWGTWWGESGYFKIAYSQLNNGVNFGGYTIAYDDGIPPGGETVSIPSTLNGSTSGIASTSYPYTAGGSSSSSGDAVQYLFDWGDGSNSGWLPQGTTTASKSWSSPGTYSVKAQARCATHTSSVSGWSGSLSVTISPPPETVSVPTVLSGQTSGIPGSSYTYTTGGSSSSYGDSVQYLFDWGNGSNSGWLPIGTISASKSWSSPGTYSVKTQARCSSHTSVTSSWSNALLVSISCPTPGIPSSPSPSNGATGVGVNPTLGWTSSNANSYEVYFGNSSPFLCHHDHSK